MLFCTITRLAKGFSSGWKSAGKIISCRKIVNGDKNIRENLTETQLDKMLNDTFPASDPVTMY